MATANIIGMERAASLTLSSRNSNSPNDSDDVKTAAVTESYARHDSHPHKPNDVESIDTQQPAGLQQLQGITLGLRSGSSPHTACKLSFIHPRLRLVYFPCPQQPTPSQNLAHIILKLPSATVKLLLDTLRNLSLQLHGLTDLTGIVASLIGGVSRSPLAKFIDLVGRPHGFFICLLCVHLSLAMIAVYQNVRTYATAQAFYWTGMDGMDYVLEIFIADISNLRDRTIWMAFTGTPCITNTSAGPKLGQRFLDESTWRWGYGAFTVITPFMCVSFWLILYVMSQRAAQ
ncbi:hypothetical protein E8E11_008310 [Didymella keratinophila]|nr:hypothetical protein E8E11_008310 [Didymella keratinophila]